MKRLLILLIIISCATLSLFNASSKADTKPSISNFVVKVDGYWDNTSKKEVKFDKPAKLCELSNNLIIFYEFRNTNNNLVLPVYDNNKEQVVLKQADKSFFNKLFVALNSKLSFYSKDNPLLIGVYDTDSQNKYGYTKYINDGKEVGIRRIRNETPLKELQVLKGEVLFIIDQKFNFDHYQMISDKLSLVASKTLNPDQLSNVFGYPEFYAFIPSRYFFKNEAGKGYLWLQKDNRTFYANGQQSSNNYKPFIHNGSLAVDLFWFTHVMNGGYSWDVEKKVRLLRLYDPQTGDPQLVDIQLTIGEKKAIVDGQEYELSFAPFLYDNKSAIYAPLKDLCFLFNAKMIWRSFDNSVLIERFNPYHKRPDLPKK